MENLNKMAFCTPLQASLRSSSSYAPLGPGTDYSYPKPQLLNFGGNLQSKIFQKHGAKFFKLCAAWAGDWLQLPQTAAPKTPCIWPWASGNFDRFHQVFAAQNLYPDLLIGGPLNFAGLYPGWASSPQLQSRSTDSRSFQVPGSRLIWEGEHPLSKLELWFIVCVWVWEWEKQPFSKLGSCSSDLWF